MPRSSLDVRLVEDRPVEKSRSFDGLEISIEIPAGGEKRGTNSKTGRAWSRPVYADYGYIRKTGAPDGDHLDCYIRPKPKKNAPVYVVHQLSPDGARYDEDKVMLGFSSAQEAKTCWGRHVLAPRKMFGGMCEFPMEHFRMMAHAGRNSKMIIASEEMFGDLKSRGLLPRGTKSPIEIAQKVTEDLNTQNIERFRAMYKQELQKLREDLDQIGKEILGEGSFGGIQSNHSGDNAYFGSDDGYTSEDSLPDEFRTSFMDEEDDDEQEPVEEVVADGDDDKDPAPDVTLQKVKTNEDAGMARVIDLTQKLLERR